MALVYAIKKINPQCNLHYIGKNRNGFCTYIQDAMFWELHMEEQLLKQIEEDNLTNNQHYASFKS